jgi:hypothetical protein
MTTWAVERIVHFDFDRGDFIVEGLVHFGFHDRFGKLYGIEHRRHFLSLVGRDGTPVWTAAKRPVFSGTPNVEVDLNFPIYVDTFPDGSLVVSNFGDSRLYRIDPASMTATLFVDGSRLGMKHAGNCVVDAAGCVWVNEVDGCRLWMFDQTGRGLLTLGDGVPGFQTYEVGFDAVRFHWIYDIRRGPRGEIFVLDSRNFAVRVVDPAVRRVRTIAGTGRPGYAGDGGSPRDATFGGDPSASFDGPISLSVDETGNVFVGDRFNRVVRMLDAEADRVITIAGNHEYDGDEPNRTDEHDPLSLRLPKISSMDYYDGRLFVPTDLTERSGDLIVLKKHS